MKHDYEDITNSRINEVIDEYIHSEQDRIILKRNLIDNWTYQQISDYLINLDMQNRTKGLFTNYGLSAKQVGRRILKKEKIVFSKIKE